MAVHQSKGEAGLIDVLDRVLDKGIVIDAAVRVAVVGVDLLGIDARIVVASIETYLRNSDALAQTRLAAAPARFATAPVAAVTLAPVAPAAPVAPPAA